MNNQKLKIIFGENQYEILGELIAEDKDNWIFSLPIEITKTENGGIKVSFLDNNG